MQANNDVSVRNSAIQATPNGATKDIKTAPSQTPDEVKATMNRAPSAPTADTLSATSSPQPASTSALAAPAKVSGYDTAVGAVAWIFVKLAYLIALSGRHWKTGSTKPPQGEKEDVLRCIQENFGTAFRPKVILARLAQTAALPLAAVGGFIELVAPSFDDKTNALGYKRTIFGYATQAVDTLVARPLLAPLFWLGKRMEAIGPGFAKVFGVKPVGIEGDGFYHRVGKGLDLILRTALSPIALCSVGYDKLVQLFTRKAIEHTTFYKHAGRGLLRLGEVVALAPAAPLFAAGKWLPGAFHKLDKQLGFKVSDPYQANPDDSARRRYWETAAVGAWQLVKLPIRIAVAPLAALSSLYNPLNRKVFGTEPAKKRAFWHHALLRGPAMVIGAPFAAIGAAAVGVARASGKTAHNNKEILWGHERSLSGYAGVGFNAIGRTVLSPFAGLEWIYDAPWNGAARKETDKSDYYERALTGLGLTVGLPITIPGALIGAGGWAYDHRRSQEPEGADRSLSGLALDGAKRTWNGAKHVWSTYIEPPVKRLGATLRRVFGHKPAEA